MLSECRRLLIKINSKIKEKPQESASLGKASIQTPEDSNRIDNICDCCKEVIFLKRRWHGNVR